MKNMLDDYVQKWRHTPEQFETNRLFARAWNPDDDSMVAGSDIFNVFKRQVNFVSAFGELVDYKRDCSKLVPSPPLRSKQTGEQGGLQGQTQEAGDSSANVGLRSCAPRWWT